MYNKKILHIYCEGMSVPVSELPVLQLLRASGIQVEQHYRWPHGDMPTPSSFFIAKSCFIDYTACYTISGGETLVTEQTLPVSQILLQTV